jgi:NAD(P)-dependent dehydrogenase (short-subunit alcohol dehydrogenase family)
VDTQGGVALVTGAASGIGRATAERLAADGQQVALVDRDASALNEVAAALRAAGGAATPIVADLGTSEQCERAVRETAQLGPLRTVVNVAGIMSQGDTVERLPDAMLEAIMAVNVLAVFRLGRHAIPLLRASGGGAIVLTTSVHAFATMDACAAYAASKGALAALTRQMALDLAADGIHVCGVAPGSVDTPLTRAELIRRGQDAASAGFATDPREIGRVMAAEEIASVIAWVASPQASALTGTTVVADAGLLARLV